MERRLKETLANGKFDGLSASRSRMMASVKSRGNKTTEWRLRSVLVNRGIRGWHLHAKGLVGNPDFYFPSHRLAVFVDGCFWHGCKRCGHVPKNNRAFWLAKIESNVERDIRITAKLRRDGIRVLRFWEHEVLCELEKCIRAIERNLPSSR
jgi:DNA mismatch endonuclease (patch repair protein)